MMILKSLKGFLNGGAKKVLVMTLKTIFNDGTKKVP